MPPVLDPDEHEKALYTVEQTKKEAVKHGDKPDDLIHSSIISDVGPDSLEFKFSTLVNHDDCCGKVIIESYNLKPIKVVGRVMFNILDIEHNSVQIKSAFVAKEYRNANLAFGAYKLLLESHVIYSDNFQTSDGAGFWNEKISDDPSITVHIVENFYSDPQCKKNPDGTLIVYNVDLSESLGTYIWGVDPSDNNDYPRIKPNKSKTNKSTVLKAIKNRCFTNDKKAT